MREKGQGVVNDAHVPEDAPKTQAGGPGSGAGGGRKRPRMSPFDDSSGGTSRIPFKYSGELGHAAPVNPIAIERIPNGRIAPTGEPNAYFDQREKRTGKSLRPEEQTAEWLRRRGVNVRSIDDTSDERLPDAVLEWTGRAWTADFKAVSSANSIQKQIRRGRAQSGCLVLRGSVSLEEIHAGLTSALRMYGGQIHEIVIIFDGGARYVHWRA